MPARSYPRRRSASPWYLRFVATEASQQQLTCPHCHKEFSAEQIGAGAQRGFKCPHCKLFVPLDRTTEPEPAKS